MLSFFVDLPKQPYKFIFFILMDPRRTCLTVLLFDPLQSSWYLQIYLSKSTDNWDVLRVHKVGLVRAKIAPHLQAIGHRLLSLFVRVVSFLLYFLDFIVHDESRVDEVFILLLFLINVLL